MIPVAPIGPLLLPWLSRHIGEQGGVKHAIGVDHRLVSTQSMVRCGARGLESVLLSTPKFLPHLRLGVDW